MFISGILGDTTPGPAHETNAAIASRLGVPTHAALIGAVKKIDDVLGLMKTIADKANILALESVLDTVMKKAAAPNADQKGAAAIDLQKAVAAIREIEDILQNVPEIEESKDSSHHDKISRDEI